MQSKRDREISAAVGCEMNERLWIMLRVSCHSTAGDATPNLSVRGGDVTDPIRQFCVSWGAVRSRGYGGSGWSGESGRDGRVAGAV